MRAVVFRATQRVKRAGVAFYYRANARADAAGVGEFCILTTVTLLIEHVLPLAVAPKGA